MSNERRPVAHCLTFQSDGAIGAPQDVAHKISLEGHPQAHKMSLEGGQRPSLELSMVKGIMRRLTNGGTSADTFFRAIGGHVTTGYQLRYVYFLDPTARERLTVPILPFSEIEKRGAGMYRGEKVSRAGVVQPVEQSGPPTDGGSMPTHPLQTGGNGEG